MVMKSMQEHASFVPVGGGLSRIFLCRFMIIEVNQIYLHFYKLVMQVKVKAITSPGRIIVRIVCWEKLYEDLKISLKEYCNKKTRKNASPTSSSLSRNAALW